MTWMCASGALQMGLFQQSCTAGLGIDAMPRPHPLCLTRCLTSECSIAREAVDVRDSHGFSASKWAESTLTCIL